MTMKTDITTPARPVAALWVRASGNFADAVSVRRVEVVCYSADGFATIRFREGAAVTERHCNISELASTPERAAAMLANHLPALIARPLLPPVAGMTATSAAPSPAAIVAKAAELAIA